MATENLKTMKEQLISCVQGQLGDISKVDTHELGEAIDMIKDLAEAIYYCTITDSMEKSDEIQKMSSSTINYYTTPMNQMPPYMNERDRTKRYMYYPQGGNVSSSPTRTGGQPMHYTEPSMEVRRDPRQGTAYMRRRMYMESKEQHRDANSQMRELEAYLQELSSDITGMLKDASAEEKNVLRQKITTLANKIQ